jgi:hypothetical protein
MYDAVAKLEVQEVELVLAVAPVVELAVAAAARG